MTREEIIQGLQFTIDMFLSDPLTGEPITKPRNNMDKTTIDACKGAIELLEQQPCEDCISREEAIGAVTNLFEMSEYPHPYPQGKPIRLREIKEKLKQLPPVQPKTGHWISVSERLPEIDDYRPCTDHEWNDGAVLYCTDKGIMGLGWYYYSTKCWANLDDRWIEQDGQVIAWMPLPEPYQPQESEKV